MLDRLHAIDATLRRAITETERAVGITAATPVTMPILQAMGALDTLIRLAAIEETKGAAC